MTLPAIPFRTKGLDHVVLRAAISTQCVVDVGLPVAKHNGRSACGTFKLVIQ